MPNEFNDKIIAEFRANSGVVGPPFAGAPMVLLTSTGARSGKPHTTPLVNYADGDRVYVFASMGGAPKHPAWYHNVVANPGVTVERGAEKYTAKARVLEGAERDDIYARQAALIPTFGDYQQKTTRTIPVVEPHPIVGAALRGRPDTAVFSSGGASAPLGPRATSTVVCDSARG
jgi:deazaflavin-dependent oxidoreductase (nitroreductase family)